GGVTLLLGLRSQACAASRCTRPWLGGHGHCFGLEFPSLGRIRPEAPGGPAISELAIALALARLQPFDRGALVVVGLVPREVSANPPRRGWHPSKADDHAAIEHVKEKQARRGKDQQVPTIL